MLQVIHLFALATTLWAQSGQNPEACALMSQANSRLGHNNCAATDPSVTADPLWLQCFKAVCPTKLKEYRNRIRAQFDGFYKDPNSLPGFKDLMPLVDEVFNEELTFDEQSMILLREELKKGTWLTDRAARILFLLTKVSPHFEKIETDLDGNLDERKTRNSLKDLPAGERESTIELARGFLRSQKQLPEWLRGNLADLAKHFSGESATAKLEEVYKQVDQLEDKMAQEIGARKEFFAGSGIERGSELRRLREGTYTEHDLDSIRSALLTRTIFDKILSDGKFASSALDKSLYVTEDLDKTLDSILKEIATFKKSPAESRTMRPSGAVVEGYKDAYETCLSTLLYAKEFLPTEAQAKAFAPVEAQMRASYVEKLKGPLSSESHSHLAPKIMSWNVRRVETGPLFLVRMKSALQEMRSDRQSDQRALAKATDKEKQIVMGMTLSKVLNSKQKNLIGSGLEEFCAENNPEELSDAARLDAKNLRFGGDTVRLGKARTSIAFHEYSHLLDATMKESKSLSKKSRQWYQNTKSCVEGQSSADILLEDWADMVSMNLNPEAESSFCEFLSDEEDFTLTVSEDAFDKKHSTTFKRVLIDLQTSGRDLPPVCRNALAAKGQSFQHKNCFSGSVR